MPMGPLESSLNVPSKITSNDLFDLPEVPADYREPEGPVPSWEQQMAHAQMLIEWRKHLVTKTDNPESGEPHRNPEPFEM